MTCQFDYELAHAKDIAVNDMVAWESEEFFVETAMKGVVHSISRFAETQTTSIVINWNHEITPFMQTLCSKSFFVKECGRFHLFKVWKIHQPSCGCSLTNHSVRPIETNANPTPEPEKIPVVLSPFTLLLKKIQDIETCETIDDLFEIVYWIYCKDKSMFSASSVQSMLIETLKQFNKKMTTLDQEIAFLKTIILLGDSFWTIFKKTEGATNFRFKLLVDETIFDISHRNQSPLLIVEALHGTELNDMFNGIVWELRWQQSPTYCPLLYQLARFCDGDKHPSLNDPSTKSKNLLWDHLFLIKVLFERINPDLINKRINILSTAHSYG